MPRPLQQTSFTHLRVLLVLTDDDIKYDHEAFDPGMCGPWPNSFLFAHKPYVR